MQTINEIMNAKRMVLLVVAALVLLSTPAAQAFYHPHTGRWLSRDPIGDRGGLNVYAFVGNRPANTFDVHGLWWNHRPFTDKAVKSVSPQLATTSKCLDRIRIELWAANSNQDDLYMGSLMENAPHYNRNPSQTGAQGETAYQDYLTEQKKDFNNQLKNPTTSHCRRALWNLGRLSHSWEDFFIHAIRRDGTGGNENSSVSGWTAWTDTPPVTGDPGNRVNFWPSSFRATGGGEHPGGINNEPVLSSSPEYGARHSAAQRYTSAQLGPLLQQWMGSCRCACEKSWGLSWYTTELPFR